MAGASLKTVGYPGFGSVTASQHSAETAASSSGLFFWSGSIVLSSSNGPLGDGSPNLEDQTTYYGVGLECVAHSESYFRYQSKTGSSAGAGSQLDIRTGQFFLGSLADGNFISGSTTDEGDTVIAITSSFFELANNGDVTMQGIITAEAGGEIGGASIGNDALAYLPFWAISASSDTTGINAPGAFISSSAFKVRPDGVMSASAGLIGGWVIADRTIEPAAGDGWLSASNVTISSSGEIKSTDFQNGITTGVSKGWRISADGEANFANATIRGTLSTVVFEKDTISAVGGAAIIANSTAIHSASGDDGYSSEGLFSGESTQTMKVDSAGGFRQGEWILCKATSSTGFVEEYMQVTDTDITTDPHTLTLKRGMTGFMAPTLTSGQVLVSQGTSNFGIAPGQGIGFAAIATDFQPGFEYGIGYSNIGTDFAVGFLSLDGAAIHDPNNPKMNDFEVGNWGSGYILMNAMSGSETPYIDIVERTGQSNYNDLDIKVRLGDLSGIDDPSVGLEGQKTFGLYTDNVYLKGVISASEGNIAGTHIGSDALSKDNLWAISSSADNEPPGGFISSSKFKVSADGRMTASEANIEGTITAQGGSIGGATINTNALAFNPYWAISASAENEPGSFISSSDFKVSSAGVITASAGLIGGMTMSQTVLSNDPYWGISASADVDQPDGFISSSGFKVSPDGRITGSQVLFTGGTITGDVTLEGTLAAQSIRTPALISGNPSTFENCSSSIEENGHARFVSASIGGFEIGETYMRSHDFDEENNGIKLTSGASPSVEIRKGGVGGNDFVKMFYTSGGSTWGIQGEADGETMFQLGSTNQIAGFTFTHEKLSNTGIEMNADQKRFKVFDTATPNDDYAELFYASDSSFGLKIEKNGNTIARLGTTNTIGGFNVSAGNLNIGGTNNASLLFDSSGDGKIVVGNPDESANIELHGDSGKIQFRESDGSIVLEIGDNVTDVGGSSGPGQRIVNGFLQVERDDAVTSQNALISAIIANADSVDAGELMVGIYGGVTSGQNFPTDFSTIFDDNILQGIKPAGSVGKVVGGLFYAEHSGTGFNYTSQDRIAVLAYAKQNFYSAEPPENTYTFVGYGGIMLQHDEIWCRSDIIAFMSSDKRLKKNVISIDNPLEKIMKIRGVEFDWDSENKHTPGWTKQTAFGTRDGDLHDVGIIAQEIQKVIPEVVRERESGYLAVNYEKLTPLLIEGIKAQQKKIEDLEARLSKLEGLL